MSKMTRHQIRKQISRIISESLKLSAAHSNSASDCYAVRHPQMKALYRDIAILAKAVRQLMTEPKP